MKNIVCLIGLAIYASCVFGEEKQFFGEFAPPPVGGAAVELSIIRAPELAVAKLLMFGDPAADARRSEVQRWLDAGTASVVRRLRGEGTYYAGGKVSIAAKDGKDEKINWEYGYSSHEDGFGPGPFENLEFVGLDVRADYQFLDDGGTQIDLDLRHDLRDRVKIDLATGDVPTSRGPSRLPVDSSFEHRAKARIQLDGKNPIFAGAAQMRFVETEAEAGMTHLLHVRGGSEMSVQSALFPRFPDMMFHTTAFMVPEEFVLETMLARGRLGEDSKILTRCFELVAEGKAELSALISGSGPHASIGQEFPEPRGRAVLKGKDGKELITSNTASRQLLGTVVQSELISFSPSKKQVEVRYAIELDLARPRIEFYQDVNQDRGAINVAWYPIYETANIGSASLIMAIDQPTMLGVVKLPFPAADGSHNWLLVFGRADVPTGQLPAEEPESWRNPEATQLTTFSVKTGDILSDLAELRPASQGDLHHKVLGLVAQGRAQVSAFAELRGNHFHADCKEESGHDLDQMDFERWETDELPLYSGFFDRERRELSQFTLKGEPGQFYGVCFTRDRDGKRTSGGNLRATGLSFGSTDLVGAIKPSEEDDELLVSFARRIDELGREDRRTDGLENSRVVQGTYLFSVPSETAAAVLLADEPVDDDLLFEDLIAAGADEGSGVRLLAVSTSSEGRAEHQMRSWEKELRGEKELMAGMDSVWMGTRVEEVRASEAEQDAFDEALNLEYQDPFGNQDPFEFLDSFEAHPEIVRDPRIYPGLESFDFPEPIGDVTSGCGYSTYVSASRPAFGKVDDPELPQRVDDFLYRCSDAGSGEARLVAVVQAEAKSSSDPEARQQSRMLFVANATDRWAAEPMDPRNRFEVSAFVFSLSKQEAAELRKLNGGTAMFEKLVASGAKPVALASGRNANTKAGSYDLENGQKIGISFQILNVDWARFDEGNLGVLYEFENHSKRPGESEDGDLQEFYEKIDFKMGEAHLAGSIESGEQERLVFIRVRKMP